MEILAEFVDAHQDQYRTFVVFLPVIVADADHAFLREHLLDRGASEKSSLDRALARLHAVVPCQRACVLD